MLLKVGLVNSNTTLLSKITQFHFTDLNILSKTIKQLPKKSYLNYLNYVYEQKQPLQPSKKTSTRKRPLKKYKQ